MTDGGAACLATTMAVVHAGVPSMSKQTFVTTERTWLAEMKNSEATGIIHEAGRS